MASRIRCTRRVLAASEQQLWQRASSRTESRRYDQVLFEVGGKGELRLGLAVSHISSLVATKQQTVTARDSKNGASDPCLGMSFDVLPVGGAWYGPWNRTVSGTAWNFRRLQLSPFQINASQLFFTSIAYTAPLEEMHRVHQTPQLPN